MTGHGLYAGDVVEISLGPEIGLGVIRAVAGDRVQVQLGTDWTWLFSEEVRWTGKSLSRVPRTERAWRRLKVLLEHPFV